MESQNICQQSKSYYYPHMSNKKSCVIFDLDGTLCELKPTTLAYAHNGEEEPIWNILEEMEKEWCMLDVEIFIVTGRKHDLYHKDTVAWLEKYNVPYDHLIMCMD